MNEDIGVLDINRCSYCGGLAGNCHAKCPSITGENAEAYMWKEAHTSLKKDFKTQAVSLHAAKRTIETLEQQVSNYEQGYQALRDYIGYSSNAHPRVVAERVLSKLNDWDKRMEQGSPDIEFCLEEVAKLLKKEHNNVSNHPRCGWWAWQNIRDLCRGVTTEPSEPFISYWDDLPKTDRESKREKRTTGLYAITRTTPEG